MKSSRPVSIPILFLTLFFAALFTVLSTLSGCTGSRTERDRAENRDAEKGHLVLNYRHGYPIEIRDALDRKITVSTYPERIVSLSPSNTEILFAVGAGSQVVGVTKYCNYPPETLELEKIGGFSAKTISVEKIISLRPDLVLSGGSIHREVIQALERSGITIASVDGTTFEGVNQDIRLVGLMTGHGEEADLLVGQIKERLEAVGDVVAGIPENERPRVFWELYDDPLMTAGPGSFIGQAIVLAGGINIFNDLEELYPKISQEELLRRDPDVILGPDSHGERLTTEMVTGRPGWSGIKAIREGRIHLLSGDIASRGSPRLIDVVETIARILYEDKFR